MTKILVTGGNGFVAAQILIAALNKDYEVVTTVRSEEKVEQTKSALLPRLGDKIQKLSFSIVKKIESEDAYDEVLKANKFDAVINSATPFHLNAKDPNEIVSPAVGGTKSILKSIKQHCQTVKRVVITSSFASIEDPSKGLRPGYVYSEKDWNPITWEQTLDGDSSHAYYGAKTWAEKAAWEFMEKEKPGFDLVTICPPMIFGQVAQFMENTDQLNTSSKTLYGIYSGQQKELPEQNVMLWVNVADVGIAHIKGIEAQDAGNHRFLITGDGVFTYKGIATSFIEAAPELANHISTKLPQNTNAEGLPVDGYYTADNDLSKRILGLQYTSFNDTMRQFVESIKHLPKSS